MTAFLTDTWRTRADKGGVVSPPYSANGGLVADTGLYIRQSRPPYSANVPSRVRARKAKQRYRGFNLRAAARVVNPELLHKLPPERGCDEAALFDLDHHDGSDTP